MSDTKVVDITVELMQNFNRAVAGETLPKTKRSKIQGEREYSLVSRPRQHAEEAWKRGRLDALRVAHGGKAKHFTTSDPAYSNGFDEGKKMAEQLIGEGLL